MYDGYFIWGDFHLFSGMKKHSTFMGYGTFEMEGDTKLVETTLKSSFESFEGRPFYIDLEFMGDDKFRQTIISSRTGIRYIEVFERL